jgi:hypothetical protein
MAAFAVEEPVMRAVDQAPHGPRSDEARPDARTWAEVDLDGHDAASHDRYRADPGAWAEAVAAVEQARTDGTATRVLTHVRRHNLAHLDDIAGLVRRLGVRRWILSFSPPAGRTRGDAPVLDQDLAAAYVRVAQARRALGRTTLAFDAGDGIPCVCWDAGSRRLCAALAGPATGAHA